MEQLREFLKGMSRAEQAEFARTCGTTIGYIRKMLCLGKPLGADTCVAIEHESGRRVTRKHLRPDDWARYWPELAEADACHDVPIHPIATVATRWAHNARQR